MRGDGVFGETTPIKQKGDRKGHRVGDRQNRAGNAGAGAGAGAGSASGNSAAGTSTPEHNNHSNSNNNDNDSSSSGTSATEETGTPDVMKDDNLPLYLLGGAIALAVGIGALSLFSKRK